MKTLLAQRAYRILPYTTSLIHFHLAELDIGWCIAKSRLPQCITVLITDTNRFILTPECQQTTFRPGTAGYPLGVLTQNGYLSKTV